MTRRSFAALAAPLLTAPDGRIRTAMVGTGHGHAHSKVVALQSMPEYLIAGVWQPDPAEPALGPAFQKVRWLSEAEVLQDASLELAVLEFADPERNLEFAQRCVEAGKWVHLDKPPGASLSGLRRLLEEAGRRVRGVQMGYQWRYHPGMQAALEAARRGWLGRVYRFRASIDKPIGAEERRHLAKYRGGMMFSEGCHLIDRATALLGKPTRVHGFLRHDSPEADGLADNNLVVLEYPGALAEISLAGFDPHGNSHRFLEILGTNGSARVQPFAPFRVTVTLKEAAGLYRAGEQALALVGQNYTPDFAELASTIRRGTPPRYTAAHDLMTHEVLLEACGML